MTEKMKKIKAANVVSTFKELLAWRFFPFITAVWVAACYYLGWDLAAIYYSCIIGVAMLLLLDDLTPLLPHILFLNVLISLENSPLVFNGQGGSDYYLRTENIVQLALLVALLVAAIIARIVISAKKNKFKPSPVFFGLCALCLAFTLNGAGSADYTFKNIGYALLFDVVILAVYAVISMNAKLTEENYKSLAYGFLAFSALLAFELAVKYITNFDNIYYDGYIHKQGIIMGWGVWNNLGMFFSICIPPVMLLASKYKYGFLFVLYSAILVMCAFLTGSRQSMMGSAFAFVSSAIAVLVKSRNRAGNAIVLGAILIAVIVGIALTWNQFKDTVERLLQGLFDWEGNYDGSGRMRLIKLAVEYFKSNPALGCGFYAPFESFELAGMGAIIPTFAHNTVAEILGACGIIGIIAYAAHRVTTIVGFFRKPTFNKFYVAACLMTFLLICLLDNYIFYILPTAVYGATLHFATGREEK